MLRRPLVGVVPHRTDEVVVVRKREPAEPPAAAATPAAV
jgi:hypothetical protein